MKRLMLVALLIVGLVPAAAGEVDAQLARAAVVDARRMNDAMKAGNHGFVVDRMNPRLVELMGGRDGALEILQLGLEQLENDGMEVVDVIVDSPTQSHETDSEFVMFLPTITTIRGGDMGMRITGHLIASRKKTGGDWFFADGGGIDAALLQTLYPGIGEGVVLPPMSQEFIDE